MAKSNKPNNTACIHLSNLETTVLCGICQGLSSNDLAKIIHKSPRTVDDYRKALCEKFGVQNKEQLISKVVALEFVPYSKIIGVKKKP